MEHRLIQRWHGQESEGGYEPEKRSTLLPAFPPDFAKNLITTEFVNDSRTAVQREHRKLHDDAMEVKKFYDDLKRRKNLDPHDRLIMGQFKSELVRLTKNFDVMVARVMFWRKLSTFMETQSNGRPASQDSGNLSSEDRESILRLQEVLKKLLRQEEKLLKQRKEIELHLEGLPSDKRDRTEDEQITFDDLCVDYNLTCDAIDKIEKEQKRYYIMLESYHSQ